MRSLSNWVESKRYSRNNLRKDKINYAKNMDAASGWLLSIVSQSDNNWRSMGS
ncbi:hypothetical protein APA_1844 [Pseudanabaena sp. lw0831]|nr:hypothetical protein APA_1844 [Pseudanabaena sp. lw0831]